MSFSTSSCNVRCVAAVRRVRCGNLLTSGLLRAGFVLCALFALTAFCDTGYPRPLTYDQIYNSTHYVQLAHYPHQHIAHSRKNSSQGHYDKPRAEKARWENTYDTNGRGHNNSSRYVQPSHYLSQQNLLYRGSNTQRYFTKPKTEELRWQDKDVTRGSGTMLVGFARDPFRQSIPEEDYIKGVRAAEAARYGPGERGKRGVAHLYNMLTCAGGCDPLRYKGYGCYCGLLGEGRPTDGIDDCCRIHDECYEKFRCPFYTVYFQPYYWKCYHGEPLCALENHSVRKGVNSCAGQLCECDRRFALCVARYPCPRGKALCRSSPLRLLQNILLSF